MESDWHSCGNDHPKVTVGMAIEPCWGNSAIEPSNILASMILWRESRRKDIQPEACAIADRSPKVGEGSD